MFNVLFKITKHLRPKYDDDKYDRFNYAYTTTFLTIALILICLKQTVGHPIHCWIPAEFDSSWEGYIERYCFIENTYYVNAEARLMPPLVKGADYEIRYYQWVSVFLVVQIVLFMIPRNFWSFASEKSGLDMYSIYGSIPPDFGKQSELQKRYKKLGNSIHEVLDFESKVRGRFWHIIPHTSYLTFVYLFYKLLQCFNVAFQVYMMNHYLNTTYSFWGYGIFHDLIVNRDWKTSGRFPRETLCNFIRRDETSSGPIQFPVQCVLMINMFNELLCIVLWVWLTFLACLNVISLIYWLITAFKSKYHTMLVKDLLEYAQTNGLGKLHFTDGDVNEFIRTRLFKDGITTIRLLSKNVGNYDASGIVHAMFEAYQDRNNGKEVEEEHSQEDDDQPKEIVNFLDDEIKPLAEAITNDNPLSAFLGTYLNYDDTSFEEEMNQLGRSIKCNFDSKKVEPSNSNKPVSVDQPIDDDYGMTPTDSCVEEIDTTTMEDWNGYSYLRDQAPPLYSRYANPFTMPYTSFPPHHHHPHPPPFESVYSDSNDAQARPKPPSRGFQGYIRDFFKTYPYATTSDSNAQNVANALPPYSEYPQNFDIPMNAHNSLMHRKMEEDIPNVEISSLQNVTKVDEVKEAAKARKKKIRKTKANKTHNIRSPPASSSMTTVSSELQALDEIVIPTPEESMKKMSPINVQASNLEGSVSESFLPAKKEPLVDSKNENLENVEEAVEVIKSESKSPDDKKDELLRHERSTDSLFSDYGMKDKVVETADIEEVIETALDNINVTSDDNESYYSAEENLKGERVNTPELINHEQTSGFDDPINVVIESSSLYTNVSDTPHFDVYDIKTAEENCNLVEPKPDERLTVAEPNDSQHFKNDVYDKTDEPLNPEITTFVDDLMKNVIEPVETVEVTKGIESVVPVSNAFKEDNIPQIEENANNDGVKDIESDDKALFEYGESEKDAEEKSEFGKLPSFEEPKPSEDLVTPDYVDHSLTPDDVIVPGIEEVEESKDKPQIEENANDDVKDIESGDQGLLQNGEFEKNDEAECQIVEIPPFEEPHIPVDFESLDYADQMRTYELTAFVDDLMKNVIEPVETVEVTKDIESVVPISNAFKEDNIPQIEENANNDGVKDIESDDKALFEYGGSIKNEPVGDVQSICDPLQKSPIETHEDNEKTENVCQSFMSVDEVCLTPEVNENVININVEENIEPESAEIPMVSDKEQNDSQNDENVGKHEEGDVIDQAEKPLFDAGNEQVYEEFSIPEPQKETEKIEGDSVKVIEMPIQVNEYLVHEVPREEFLPKDDKAVSHESAVHDNDSIENTVTEEHSNMNSDTVKEADQYELPEDLPDDLQNFVDIEKESHFPIEETPDPKVDGHGDILPVDGKGELLLPDFDSLIPPSETIFEDSSVISPENPPYHETADMVIKEIPEHPFNDAFLSAQTEEQMDIYKKGEERVEPQNVEVFIPSHDVVVEDPDVSKSHENPIVVQETDALLSVEDTQNVEKVLKHADDGMVVPLVEDIETNHDFNNFVPLYPAVEVEKNLVDNFTVDWPILGQLDVDESEVKKTSATESEDEFYLKFE